MMKKYVAILVVGLSLTASAFAVTGSVTQDFESVVGNTVPDGWSFVDSSGGTSGTYANTTGNGGGIAADVRWNDTAAALPKAYIVNSGGLPMDASKPISGSFDFNVATNVNYARACFFFGDIGDGLTNGAGEYLNMDLRKATFGARAQLLDGDGTALLTGNNSNWEINGLTWYTANFMWTPTNGATGVFHVDWGGTEFMDYSNYTFNARSVYFGYGTGFSPGLFDNINITGSMIMPAGTVVVIR